MLISADVVNDHVNVRIEWFFHADASQEAQELLLTVPGFAPDHYRTGACIQGGKSWGDAMRI